MASIKDISQGRSDVYLVKPSDLKIKDGWNGRDMTSQENIDHVDELAQSIAAVGVKEALTAYMEEDGLYIENGHMRHAASLLAISKYGADPEMTVPVRTSAKDGTEAERILSQIIRNSGKQFSPLEMAGVFKRLNVAGLTDAEIARRAGISRVYVGDLVELSNMPKEVTKFVRNGDVSATLAITTMKKSHGDGKKVAAKLKDALAFAKSKGKTRATAKHVKDDTPKTPKATPAAKQEAEAPRRSMVSVMADVRTIVEKATIEPDGEEILIVFTKEEYAEFSKLLDLTPIAERKVPTPAVTGDESEVPQEAAKAPALASADDDI